MRKTAALTVHKRFYGITLENEFSDFVDTSYLYKYIMENAKNGFFQVPISFGISGALKTPWVVVAEIKKRLQEKPKMRSKKRTSKNSA